MKIKIINSLLFNSLLFTIVFTHILVMNYNAIGEKNLILVFIIIFILLDILLIYIKFFKLKLNHKV